VQRHLIVVAKRPLAGYAKTRLGADIGPEHAAGVYARLLYGLLIQIAESNWTDVAVELAVAAHDDVAHFESAFPEFVVRPQTTGDMGTRLAASFSRAYAEGAQSVVLVASDVSGLTARHVRVAFDLLDPSRCPGLLPGVIGPTADGGYYLIGMRAPGAALFEGVAWSTTGVLAQTEELAVAHRVALAQLPQLMDVDVRADYEVWQATLGKGHGAGSDADAAGRQRTDGLGGGDT
jgi:uncharacterized protein